MIRYASDVAALIAVRTNDSKKLPPRPRYELAQPRDTMVRSKAAQAKRKRLEADGASAPPPRRPKTDTQPKEDDGLDPKRVYVSRLPKAWTDEVLAEKFAPFGGVQRASVMLDATTNASRGFGFVVFDDEGGKANALEAKYIKGRLPDRSRYACKVSDVNRGGDDVCRLWLERRCPHGESCKFSHPAGRGGPLVASQASVKKCLEFRKKGKCSRGDACPFAHVAREKPKPVADGPKRCFTWAKKGKCRKGDRCKYAHT